MNDKPTITVIGAASTTFGPKVLRDILNHPQVGGATFRFVDINEERLAIYDRLARRLSEVLPVPVTVESTTDRIEALPELRVQSPQGFRDGGLAHELVTPQLPHDPRSLLPGLRFEFLRGLHVLEEPVNCVVHRVGEGARGNGHEKGNDQGHQGPGCGAPDQRA